MRKDLMRHKMRIAIIQMHVDELKQTNIETAVRYIIEAANEGADVAVLPEMFCCPFQMANFPPNAEYDGGSMATLFANLAKELGIYIVAGSWPEKDSEDKIYNTTYAFDRKGNVIGKHRKMHLFDIQVEGGLNLIESDTITAGSEVTVIDTEFGKIGLLICYDIRFPELARLIVDEGAGVIIVPAAFNMTTGPAHWEILFRCRALDNQVFTIGTAPARNVDSSYVSYGNSIVVSPWGEVLYRMDEKEGLLVAELDLDFVEKVRKELPMLEHRRKDIYTLSKI